MIGEEKKAVITLWQTSHDRCINAQLCPENQQLWLENFSLPFPATGAPELHSLLRLQEKHCLKLHFRSTAMWRAAPGFSVIEAAVSMSLNGLIVLFVPRPTQMIQNCFNSTLYNHYSQGIHFNIKGNKYRYFILVYVWSVQST